MARLATPIFDHIHPKTFRSTFDLCEFVSTYNKKSRDYKFVFIVETVYDEHAKSRFKRILRGQT